MHNLALLPMPSYHFRPITRSDFPMFRTWLSHPHIGGWWGDGSTELALVEDDMKTGLVDMWIVEWDDVPFAFIQDYNAHAFGAPQYAGFPDNARAIDTFLGEPSFLGCGHGAGYLAARLSQLHAQTPVVLTDPSPENTRAIRAYAAAGFHKDKVVRCEDGDFVQVMVSRALSRQTPQPTPPQDIDK